MNPRPDTDPIDPPVDEPEDRPEVELPADSEKHDKPEIAADDAGASRMAQQSGGGGS